MPEMQLPNPLFTFQL